MKITRVIMEHLCCHTFTCMWRLTIKLSGSSEILGIFISTGWRMSSGLKIYLEKPINFIFNF